MKALTKKNRVKIQSDNGVMLNDKPCPNIGFIGYPEHHLLEALALAKKKIREAFEDGVKGMEEGEMVYSLDNHEVNSILDDCFQIGQDVKGDKE